jgi:hypothetical protein
MGGSLVHPELDTLAILQSNEPVDFDTQHTAYRHYVLPHNAFSLL